MTATINAMEFLPVDKVPANSLMPEDYIMVDGEIVLVKEVYDGEEDKIIIEYVDDYDELGEIALNYETMLNIYMLFD